MATAPADVPAAPAKPEEVEPDHSSITDDVLKQLQAVGLSGPDLSFRHVPIVAELPKTKKSPTEFEFAEHSFLGDTISLKMADGSTQLARNAPFTFDNGLRLTYGQINGLAGDFYGTTQPISDGASLQDQVNRFTAAFNTLAINRARQPAEANAILAILQNEVNSVNQAVRDGRDPSTVYANLPDVDVSLQAATIARPGDQPSYLGLALINWDHFGDDARKAYNAGHYAALQQAVRGTPVDLLNAYRMNAFADHFLEDSFSAGHARTPRRVLHGTIDIFADRCAKYMHDEDNAIGLDVSDRSGNRWRMYGDKRGLDNVDKTNQTKCKQAVQASADEIYNAWRNRTAPQPGNYQAWSFAPTLESARGQQELAPLFTADGQRRNDLAQRRQWNFTRWFTYATTVLQISTGSLWNYPIQL